MDYKEKYEEMFDKLNTLIDDCKKKGHIIARVEDIEAIFPELKESEDERIRKELIGWLKNTDGQVLPIERYDAALAWLEKQGEQKPVEWSEEDENMVKETLYFIREYQQSNRCKDESGMQNSRTCENWLKSLRPQKQWKPSEGQIRALEYVIENAHNVSYSCEVVKELLNQLKQL